MCTVLMGNSSQVLIKKKRKKKKDETLISLVTLSPLIYIFIHHELGKLISDCTHAAFEKPNHNSDIKKNLMFAKVFTHKLMFLFFVFFTGCTHTLSTYDKIQGLVFVKPESSVI